MAQFGVSRMTTNRALQMLTAEGVVVRKAGIGTFVSESPFTDAIRSEITSEMADTVEPQLEPTVSTIGFVIPRLGLSVGTRILAEVERQLHRREMAMSLACSYGDQAIEQAVIARSIAAGAKGLIVFPVNGEFYSPALLRLHVERFPIVLVDKQLRGIPLPFVTTDNMSAARELIEHLIQLGHEKIAFFSPPCEVTSTLTDRLAGYQQALETAGLPVISEHQLCTVPWNEYEDGFDVAQMGVIEQFLLEHSDVTAVLVTEDQLAEYWLTTVRKLGRRVPEDFSIVCFDGPSPKPIYWEFTCALQDQEGMATHAVRILVDLLQGRTGNDPEAVTLPAKLHFGQSTASAPKQTAVSNRKAVTNTH